MEVGLLLLWEQSDTRVPGSSSGVLHPYIKGQHGWALGIHSFDGIQCPWICNPVYVHTYGTYLIRTLGHSYLPFLLSWDGVLEPISLNTEFIVPTCTYMNRSQMTDDTDVRTYVHMYIK